MNPLLTQALFLAVPLALLGLEVLAVKWAVRKGWIVLRREPTEMELAMERMRHATMTFALAISDAFTPVLAKLLVSVEEFVKAWNGVSHEE